MNANEIITNEEVFTNEEVIEKAKDVVTTTSGSVLKKTVGIGLGLLMCGITYKYAIKPIITKIKTKKKQNNTDVVSDNDCCEDEILDIDNYREDSIED